jgi:predicted 3-demethylubiquinone-9 3-methyltransferase (glyoxalase superfamily)
MAHQITPFLMFQGAAEEAIQFYVALFRDSQIKRIERYGPGELGAEGSVKLAEFRIVGQDVLRIDSSVNHPFSFTPATSFFVECESEAELDTLFGQLSESGQVLMPLGDYGFSRKFGWVNDRFGVSWQLNWR